MAGADGRLWFDEDGALNLSERLPRETLIAELVERLDLFLARMDSCERTDSGDHSLTSKHAGTMGGARVLWHNVLLVALSVQETMLPPPSPEHLVALERDGVAGFQDGPVCFAREFLPTVEALHQLTFAILENETGEWRGTMPERTVSRIRGIRAELELYLRTFPRPSLTAAVERRSLEDAKPVRRPAERRAYEGFCLAYTEREELSTTTPDVGHHAYLREHHPEFLVGAQLKPETWMCQARRGRAQAEGRMRGVRKPLGRSIVREGEV